MKTITLIGGITGVLMAVFAYFAEWYGWLGIEAIVTMGFAGYVLIITAIAYFLLSWLTKGVKELEVL